MKNAGSASREWINGIEKNIKVTNMTNDAWECPLCGDINSHSNSSCFCAALASPYSLHTITERYSACSVCGKFHDHSICVKCYNSYPESFWKHG